MHGSSAELATYGNVWVLDLTALEEPLVALGEYAVVVETIGDDNQTRKDEAILVLEEENPTKTPETTQPYPGVSNENKVGGSTVTPAVPQPIAPKAEEVPEPKSIVQGVLEMPLVPLVVAMVVVSGVALFVAARRRRARADDWADYYDIMHR